MLTKISPYISSLVSEHVSKLVGKNKSILVDTETGMLYYKDKKNQTKLLPNQDANLIKIYKLKQKMIKQQTIELKVLKMLFLKQ